MFTQGHTLEYEPNICQICCKVRYRDMDMGDKKTKGG